MHLKPSIGSEYFVLFTQGSPLARHKVEMLQFRSRFPSSPPPRLNPVPKPHRAQQKARARPAHQHHHAPLSNSAIRSGCPPKTTLQPLKCILPLPLPLPPPVIAPNSPRPSESALEFVQRRRACRCPASLRQAQGSSVILLLLSPKLCIICQMFAGYRCERSTSLLQRQRAAQSEPPSSHKQ